MESIKGGAHSGEEKIVEGIEGVRAAELFKLVLSAGTRGYELEAEEISGRAGSEQEDEVSSSSGRSQRIV